MSIQNINVPAGITILSVNTLSTSSKVVLLPTCSTNVGRLLLVKDTYGNAQANNIQISTTGVDRIDGRINRYPFSTSWGTLSLVSDGGIAWRVSGLYTGFLTPAGPIPPIGPSLYPFTSHTFTNATATGRFGPTLTQCRTAYSATTWASNDAFFNMTTQGYQLWTVPRTGVYTITCAGAGGGGASASFGCGRIIQTTVSLTQGSFLQIVVGQQGISNGAGQSSGGGGGSFVASGSTPATGVCLVAGGGGGGFLGVATSSYSAQNGSATTSGNNSSDGMGTGGTGGNGGQGAILLGGGWGGGGGGFSTNGTAGSQAAGFGFSGLGFAFVNGCAGGDTATIAVGGFGGGAGTHGNTGGGGGGGGYSGGGGSGQNASGAVGGGGGSFPGGLDLGLNQNMGYVTIVAP